MLLVGTLLGGTAGAFACHQDDCQRAMFLLGEAVGVAPVLVFDWTTARRPARPYFAGSDRPRPPPVRLDGWAVTVPVAAGRF
jgi:hypothetical protein